MKEKIYSFGCNEGDSFKLKKENGYFDLYQIIRSKKILRNDRIKLNIISLPKGTHLTASYSTFGGTNVSVTLSAYSELQKDGTWKRLSNLESQVIFNMDIPYNYSNGVKRTVKLEGRGKERYMVITDYEFNSEEKLILENVADSKKGYLTRLKKNSSVLWEVRRTELESGRIKRELNSIPEYIKLSKTYDELNLSKSLLLEKMRVVKEELKKIQKTHLKEVQ